MERFPDWGTTTWVDAIEDSIGGNGANTSYTLAMLGTPVRLVGKVGSDMRGDWVLSKLKKAGVDTSAVTRSDHPTTSTVCVVNANGDRLFLHKLGSSRDVDPADLDLTPGAASHFHLANLFALPKIREGAGELLRSAHAMGLTTSLDTGWDASGRWIKAVGPCLPHVDLMFVNEKEAEMLTGREEPQEIVRALRDHGARDVIVKLGALGCAVFFDNEAHQAPSFEVKCVDTTGAGDAFAGAFLSALYRERSYPDAAKFANAVGALNVERLGAVGGVRDFEETEVWMTAQHKL